MSSANTALSFPFGTTALFDLTFKRSDGSAIDLTGASMAFMLFLGSYDAESAALVTKTIGSGITLIDAVNGLARLQLNPADTSGLDASRKYRFRCRTTLASGEIFVATAHQGTLDCATAADDSDA